MKSRKSPKIKKRKIGLLNASYSETYEFFHVGGAFCEYLIHFHKKMGLTSWVSLPASGESREEIRSALSKIDKFRLSLHE